MRASGACSRLLSLGHAHARREWSPGLSTAHKERRDQHRLGRARGVSKRGKPRQWCPRGPIRATPMCPLAGRYVPRLAANVDGPDGWRCLTCHPAVHLPVEAVGREGEGGGDDAPRPDAAPLFRRAGIDLGDALPHNWALGRGHQRSADAVTTSVSNCNQCALRHRLSWL
jgi:hypothetical protein